MARYGLFTHRARGLARGTQTFSVGWLKALETGYGKGCVGPYYSEVDTEPWSNKNRCSHRGKIDIAGFGILIPQEAAELSTLRQLHRKGFRPRELDQKEDMHTPLCSMEG